MDEYLARGARTSPIEYIIYNACDDSRIQYIINYHYGFQYVQGKRFKLIPNASPAFALGGHKSRVPYGTVYISNWLISILSHEELEWVILHELAHIDNNHIDIQNFSEVLKFGGLAYLVFRLKWPIINAILGFEVLRSIFAGVTGGVTINHELEADRIASYAQGTAKYGISTLWKISGGNIDFVTHIAKGFIFQGPYLTVKERIEFLQSYDRSQLI